MEDKVFKREQVRRDLQEAINSLDEAIACESEGKETKDKDIVWLLKLMPVNFEMKTLVDTFLPKKESEEV